MNKIKSLSLFVDESESDSEIECFDQIEIRSDFEQFLSQNYTEREAEALLSHLAKKKIEVGKRVGFGEYGHVFVTNDGARVLKIFTKQALANQKLTQDALAVYGEEDCVARPQTIISLQEKGKSATRLAILIMNNEGKGLNKECGKYSVEDKEVVAKQILEIVASLRRSNLLHRDIKLGNFVINEEKQVKLIDFGVAKRLGRGEKAETPIGTVSGRSLEMVKKEEYGFGSDDWSCGTTLYQLFEGEPFFKDEGDILFPRKISFKTTPPIFQEVIKGLLHRNQTERLSAEEALDLIERQDMLSRASTASSTDSSDSRY